MRSWVGKTPGNLQINTMAQPDSCVVGGMCELFRAIGGAIRGNRGFLSCCFHLELFQLVGSVFKPQQMLIFFSQPLRMNPPETKGGQRGCGGHVQRGVLCLLSAEITHVQNVSGVR